MEPWWRLLKESQQNIWLLKVRIWMDWRRNIGRTGRKYLKMLPKDHLKTKLCRNGIRIPLFLWQRLIKRYCYKVLLTMQQIKTDTKWKQHHLAWKKPDKEHPSHMRRYYSCWKTRNQVIWSLWSLRLRPERKWTWPMIS